MQKIEINTPEPEKAIPVLKNGDPPIYWRFTARFQGVYYYPAVIPQKV
jgi:hypothetical protein